MEAEEDEDEKKKSKEAETEETDEDDAETEEAEEAEETQEKEDEVNTEVDLREAGDLAKESRQDKTQQGGEETTQNGAGCQVSDDAYLLSHCFVVGEAVRLKGLQADKTMNGLVGSLVSCDTHQGRWLVRLDGGLGDVRVRELNIEKVPEQASSMKGKPGGPPTSRKSERTAALFVRKPTSEAAPKQSPERMHGKTNQKAAKTTVPKAAVVPKAKAGDRKRSKHGAISAAGKRSRGGSFIGAAACTFDVSYYRICSAPSLQVLDPLKGRWRPCHLYQSLQDGRIVIWYGADEYEGLPPSKPYKFVKVPLNLSGFPAFTGGGPGELLDGDGELVPTRAKSD